MRALRDLHDSIRHLQDQIQHEEKYVKEKTQVRVLLLMLHESFVA